MNNNKRKLRHQQLILNVKSCFSHLKFILIQHGLCTALFVCLYLFVSLCQWGNAVKLIPNCIFCFP